MRIKASSIRAIPGVIPDKELGKKILVALKLLLPEAFQFVNITSRIIIEPHQFTDGLGISIFDPEMDAIQVTPPVAIHVWRPGEKEPVEIVKDKIAYRILTNPDHTLGVYACWE